jgi:hypothetical protein
MRPSDDMLHPRAFARPGTGRVLLMRFFWSSVLSCSLAALAACSGSFGAGQGADAGGDDATEENPPVEGMGADGGKHDGAAADAGHPDATSAADTGSTGAEAGGEGGGVAEGGDEGPGCAPGDIECGGACVPSDVHNCGTCGHDCTNLVHVAGATSCTAAGACSFPASACATGWADCDGKPDDGCETDITKPGTCGSCTNVCPANEPVCAGGTCVSGCPTGTPTLCTGTCVDTTSNANDCSGCGLACPSTVQNAQPTCAGSKCTFACNGGFTGCPTAAPTACVDEQHDATNCGACGKTCPGPTMGSGLPACAAGACTLSCNAGLTACPTASPTECADTVTDLSNCGSCGDVCSTAVQNAHPTCGASMCGFACNTGFLLCNANTCIPGPDTVNGAFVSAAHGSGTACSSTQPCTTVAAAIATGNATIYLDAGTYDEQVALPATSVTIHGGWTYSPGGSIPWTNCGGTNTTSILSAPAGQASTVTTSGAGTWTLDTLTIQNDTTATAGQSLYGVFGTSGALSLTNVAVVVAAGGAGTPATTGGTGGLPAPASCTGNASCTGLVPGATGAAGAPGQGTYGAAGFSPGSGGTAQPGVQGCNGAPGGAGQQGIAGRCQTGECNTFSTSAGAGTPGCGGGFGGPGAGGSGGGASIGVFSSHGTVTMTGGSVATGAGGQGGQGSAGGLGAPGTNGAVGTPDTYNGCTTVAGTCSSTGPFHLNGGPAGGPGATGGSGGPGGGGAGGDSLCYAITATDGWVVWPTAPASCGTGGKGGLDGAGTTAAQGIAGLSTTHN